MSTARADRVVVTDLGSVVPPVQGHRRVEAGGARASLGAGALAPADLIGEDEFEELGVAELPGPGEGEPLGEGV